MDSKKIFSFHESKWPEAEAIMKDYGCDYEVIGRDKEKRLVNIRTSMAQKELHIIADMATCRVLQKNNGFDPEDQPMFPFSLIASFKYKKKYINDRGITFWQMSHEDADKMIAQHL